MFKKLTPIIGIAIILTGVLGWQMHSFSQDDIDKEELIGPPPKDDPGDLTDLFKVDDCALDECCITYRTAMRHVKESWSENLKTLLDQEKPASEMVDEAFENMRSYHCWMEYICRAVQYSAWADPETVYNTGITSKHIGTIPGCQAPEEMGKLSRWDPFIDWMKENWDILEHTVYPHGLDDEAVAELNMEFPNGFFNPTGLPFFPQCMTDITNKNAHPVLTDVNARYNTCISIIEEQFGCTEDDEDCQSGETAFVMVETALKKNNADQKTRVLESKLHSILTKMIGMEQHAKYINTQIQQLDSLYECYPPKCD